MTMRFHPIDMDRQTQYLGVLSRCPAKYSDYSFINLWGWAEIYGLEWAWEDSHVWIRQTIPEIFYWAPVGPWAATDWKRTFKDHIPSDTVFIRIPAGLLDIWKNASGGRIDAEESKEHWDYLYDKTELIELRGKRFHKKKNLLNQFKKKYDFEYKAFTKDMVHMALGMQADWCTWRDCESSAALEAENRVILRILNQWEKLTEIRGGALIVDRKMVAYTVAEEVAQDTLLIHFEKGNPDYKGVYQAINQMFLAHSNEEIKYANREQDLGNEGLRKAKLSYNPVDFNRKYRIKRVF